MIDALLIVLCVLMVAALALLVALLMRRPRLDLTPLLGRIEGLERGNERAERAVREDAAKAREEAAEQARLAREETGRGRDEAAGQARHLREETAGALKAFNDSVLAGMMNATTLQKSQLDALTGELGKLLEAGERRAEALRLTVEQKLVQIQEANDRKLEEMRKTVDEKLQGTLDQRLGESFKLVTERLEAVHKGLGEMQTLASGVGDLKRVLTNVKSRGTWAEYQLEALLEQVLTREQYGRNVATKGGSERVEFAVRLPGRDAGDAPVWLPIDSKFPKEDYERLIEAADRGDGEGVEAASRALAASVIESARTIRDNYLDPPATTDFAIMYLPVEGLFAEVLRRPGVIDRLQREFRVNVTGPTTLGALLNSLQMGFRTLAIQKRSSEVWILLGAVKTEFEKFGEALAKVKKKLDDAGGEFDKVAVRTRAIERKLRDVEILPAVDGAGLLAVPPLPAPAADDAELDFTEQPASLRPEA